ncbi:hypothetical protein A7X81_08715 [Campylobacter ornithocola]|uniref:Uncharacterized protein n=1 Tax=Campylobacter ornithocola TaxID=1848766 RepID=A0A6M8MVS3_9BACT|nr:hypothetical protein [Campylobacter ornithocola]OCX43307.1 hypothetical protein A7X81_08715 [Campylobacter ornithocola]QKF56778.1 putative membrane protein [Campylobacter ornithocola]
MKIRLFFFASLVYLLIIVALVYNLNLGNYTFTISTFELNLPISLWVILPALFLMILALTHMSFYGFLKHLQYKNLIKDSKNYENFIVDIFLKKVSKIKFKTQEFQNIAKNTQALYFKEKIQNPKIDDIVDILEQLDKKEFVELKKYKLDPNNEIFILNEKNHFQKDSDYAFSFIKNKDTLTNELEIFAYKKVLENAPYSQIKTLKIQKNQDDILLLLHRFEKESLELNHAEIEVLLSINSLDEAAYLQSTKILYKKVEPQVLIALFKKLKDNQTQALRAYFYTLAEFGMYDELLNELGNNQNEYRDFRLLLFLREHNKKIELDKFIQ